MESSIIRPELLTVSPDQLRALAPYFILFCGAMLAIVLSVIRVASPKWPVFITALVTCLAGVVASQTLAPDPTLPLFGGMMVSDSYSNIFNILFLLSALFTLMVSFKYLDKDQLQYPEFYVLVLLSALGMMLMASALDLIVIFIALETLSLGVYVLVGFRRADRRSNEAALKYFILGSAASAVFLYGSALLYGATGSTRLTAILNLVQSTAPETSTALFALGAWLVILGFLFKVASVPFHMWMPDVYEGAPAPVTGFMTTGLKAAAFATFVRVFLGLGYGHGLSMAIQTHIHDIIWVCAVLTMLLGNVVALTQTNLKRMLAYSSIAHTGYLLVGVLAGPASEGGFAGIVLYLVAYSVMNIGAFAIFSMISSKDDVGLNLHDLSGLSQRHPFLAFAMAVFLFSMAGVPPTAGFVAKYQLFYGAVQAGEIWIVILGVLCSAISAYYYLRVLVYMYMREPASAAGRDTRATLSSWALIAVAVMVFLTLQVGFMPARMMNAARSAVASL